MVLLYTMVGAAAMATALVGWARPYYGLLPQQMVVAACGCAGAVAGSFAGWERGEAVGLWVAIVASLAALVQLRRHRYRSDRSG